MPSKSPAQAHLMAAVAHNPAFAKKVGIPVGVGQEFNQADMAKKPNMPRAPMPRKSPEQMAQHLMGLGMRPPGSFDNG